MWKFKFKLGGEVPAEMFIMLNGTFFGKYNPKYIYYIIQYELKEYINYYLLVHARVYMGFIHVLVHTFSYTSRIIYIYRI